MDLRKVCNYLEEAGGEKGATLSLESDGSGGVYDFITEDPLLDFANLEELEEYFRNL